MMSDESGERHDMTDAEWEILRQVLPTGRPGPVRRNDRQVMDGIFYILRSGAPWRDLPPRYGDCESITASFDRDDGRTFR